MSQSGRVYCESESEFIGNEPIFDSSIGLSHLCIRSGSESLLEVSVSSQLISYLSLWAFVHVSGGMISPSSRSLSLVHLVFCCTLNDCGNLKDLNLGWWSILQEGRNTKCVPCGLACNCMAGLTLV